MNEPTHFKKGKTICLDFDGVVHMYTSLWTATNEVNDGPVPEAFEFIAEAIEDGWEIAIHSCRSELATGREAMRVWTHKYMVQELGAGAHNLMMHISFPEHKPHADVYIDDRGLGFDGTFPNLDEIKEFKPWNKM